MTFPDQRGILIVGQFEEDDGRVISIYRDPEGLRSFGELLIAEAARDQRQFPKINLPDDERHHLHLRPGVHVHPQSLPIIVGRLDYKQSGKLLEAVHPKRLKPVRRVVEQLSDEA